MVHIFQIHFILFSVLLCVYFLSFDISFFFIIQGIDRRFSSNIWLLFTIVWTLFNIMKSPYMTRNREVIIFKFLFQIFIKIQIKLLKFSRTRILVSFLLFKPSYNHFFKFLFFEQFLVCKEIFSQVGVFIEIFLEKTSRFFNIVV